MNQSIIVTDSGADLPKEYIEKHEIVFLPLSYTIDGQVYTDDMGESLAFPAFYQLLQEGKMPTTAQVAPNSFIEALTPYLLRGYDVLYVGFSSNLSGTYQSSVVAKNTLASEFPDRRIITVDTLAASLGQGLLVDYAVRMKAEGKDIEEIAQWIEDHKLNLNHWFTVDDINHLFRGGRVSRVAAFAGTLLSIKPVLHVNNEGKLIPISKLRGRKKALKELSERLNQMGENVAGQRIFISHGDALEDAEYVASLIKEKYNNVEFMFHYIGPVIGAHAGPGTIALFFLGKEREDFVRQND